MTNAQIIEIEKQELAKQGILKYTGRTFKAVNAGGEEVELKEVEAIHTFATWKSMGYIVRKGEHAKAKIMIWKYQPGKDKEAEAETEEGKGGKMFMKLAFFFTADQVEEVKA